MGVQINGDTGNISATKADYSGNVTIGGTLTYEDVTNVDSIGIVTARNGIEVGARPGVGASISVDGNALFSGITTAVTLKATTGIVTTLTSTTGIVTTLTTNTLTANSTTKVGSGVTLSPDGDVFATGVCTATSFSGDGSGLTGAGKVVALAFASSTTNEQTPSGADTWTLVGPQITHTAASTSNKLVFFHTHHLMIEGSMHWRMALWRDGTSGTNVYQMKTYTQLSANWSAVKGIQNVTTTAPDTSSHTYQFAIYRSTGSDSLLRYSPNSESTGSQITMLEIQP